MGQLGGSLVRNDHLHCSTSLFSFVFVVVSLGEGEGLVKCLAIVKKRLTEKVVVASTVVCTNEGLTC